MTNQSKSEQKEKSAYAMHTTTLAKNDERYWQKRIYRQKHRNQRGLATEDKTYSVQITHDKKRKTFQLHTANKKTAAQKARDIYLSLKSNGWEETLDRFTPKKTDIIEEATVGDLLRIYAEVADVPTKTAANYARALRTVVADIKKISRDKSRFDYVNGGADKWRAKIDNVPLSFVTPAKIQRWKLAYVKSKAINPVKENSAKLTVNSYIRYCRSLFSVKVMPYLEKELNLPNPLPFQSIDLYPRQSMRYESSFDIEQLAMMARDHLPNIEQDQQWLIFTLAVSAGLRRNEIDKLTWRQIDLDRNTISLAATKYFKPKSENSGTLVSIDPDLAAMLRGYRAKSKGEFVIESNNAPKLRSNVPLYRSERHFKALIKWLRANGIEDRKPLHTLRKEAGSLVNQKHGLYAASHFLRHADIQVTSAHYVDNKEIITSGLGALLAGNVESIRKGKDARHA